MKFGQVDITIGGSVPEQAITLNGVTNLATLSSPRRHVTACLIQFVVSRAMTNVHGNLSARFDFIVVDATLPVLLVALRVLAEQADRTVLAIRRDSTPRDVVARVVVVLAPVSERQFGATLPCVCAACSKR